MDFDPTAGVDDYTVNGVIDVYVLKIGPDLSYHWARTFGGDFMDLVYDVAVDAEDNIYIVGWFKFTVDFDPSTGEDWHTAAEDGSAFVTSLTTNGDYRWTRTLPGPGASTAISVAVGLDGNVIVGGRFRDTIDLAPDLGGAPHTSLGYHDLYLIALDSSGHTVWTYVVGSEGDEWLDHLAISPSGDIAASGFFGGTADFDPGPGLAQHTASGSLDGYITMLTASGQHRWTRTIGGSDNGFYENISGLAFDPQGYIVAAGYYGGTVDFNPDGPPDLITSDFPSDVFVTKFRCLGAAVECPVITGQPDDVSACLGEPVHFRVTVTGDAPLRYQWRHDGVAIAGATASTYAIDSVALPDAGGYDVVVTNDCGSATSDPATLTIHPLPLVDITATPGPTVCQGTTVTLEASAGLAQYAWSPGGETSRSIEVTLPGTYAVEVTDQYGCENGAQITIRVVLPGAAGDFDSDCDVDLDDYQHLHSCLAGPAGGLSPGCKDSDLTGDSRVDLKDYAVFQLNFTGQL